MSGSIRPIEPQTEYWQPADPESNSFMEARVCSQCATEMAAGARFCHVCGATREGKKQSSVSSVKESFVSLMHSVNSRVRAIHWAEMFSAIGLNTSALIAFGAGVICLLCAIFVGAVYQVQTTLD